MIGRLESRFGNDSAVENASTVVNMNLLEEEMLLVLLLRHIIIKRWRHIIMKAMERVQLVDQVRTAGESVDAAHIDEKRSKRRVA